jgi:hypothetical protein
MHGGNPRNPKKGNWYVEMIRQLMLTAGETVWSLSSTKLEVHMLGGPLKYQKDHALPEKTMSQEICSSTKSKTKTDLKSRLREFK